MAWISCNPVTLQLHSTPRGDHHVPKPQQSLAYVSRAPVNPEHEALEIVLSPIGITSGAYTLRCRRSEDLALRG